MAQQDSYRHKIRLLLGRFGISYTKGALILLAILCCCVLGVFIFVFSRPKTELIKRHASSAYGSLKTAQENVRKKVQDKKEDDSYQTNESAKIVVDVDGAVVNPGVYSLKGSDVRVQDAISSAGGLTQDAKTISINLAAPLVDGQKIYIPHIGEDALQESADASLDQIPSTAKNPTPPELININTASIAELQELPGVGEATALAIIKEREQNGAFTAPEDIMRVSGIGEKKFQKMEGQICV